MASDGIGLDISVEGNAEVKIKSIGDAVKKFEATTVRSLGNSSSAFETFKGVVAGEVVVHALERMADAAVEFAHHLIVDGIKAAEEYEVSLNRLNVALASNGNFSKEASKEFEEYASHIQNTTKYSDDAVLASAALLETLTKLDVEGLKKAETGVIDLAAALNIDLESASSLVAKAIEGNTAALGRYGIKVKEGETQTETLANVMAALAKFAGTAEGQVNTFAGATARLAHAQEDSHKNLGFLITQNQAVVNVISELTNIVGENAEAGKKNAQVYKEVVAQGLIVAADAAAAFVIGLDAIATIGKVSFYGVEGAINSVSLGIITLIDGPFALLYKGLSLLPGIGEHFAEKFNAILENAAGVAATINKDAKGIEDSLGGPSSAAKEFEANILRLRDAAVSGMAAIKSGAEAGVDPINQTRDATIELTKAQLDLIAAGEKVAERLAGEDPTKKYEKDLEALMAFYESKGELDQADFDNLDRLGLDRDTKNAERAAKEISDLRAKNEAMAGLDSERFAGEIAANEAKIAKIKDAEGRYSKASLEDDKKIADKKYQIQQQSAQAVTGILGNLANVAQAFGEDGFEAAKHIQAAQAIVMSLSAAVAALAPPPIGVGPVFGPILAATSIASGVATAAKIEGTHLATGIDEVPAGFERDNFPAYLQTGERVVPKETNKDLKSFLDGNGPMVALLQSIDSKLGQLQPHLYIDGREVFGAIRNQLNSGRAFT